MTEARLERFWSKVVIGKPDECWEWTASKNRDGYGSFKLGGKLHRAHRLSWQFAYGPIPAGLLVLHHCDNPGCVNPYHLFLGTDADNQRDAESRGRMRHPRGEDHGRAKLTSGEVVAIRLLLAKGKRSQQSIADEFGVTQVLISCIKTGKAWGWLED